MSAPLRLGVDARKLLDDRRGIGRYVRALLRSWSWRARDKVELTLLVPDLFPAFIAGRLAAETGVRLPVARIGSRGFDAVWYPWNGMTWVAPGIKVATVHDCWPFASPADNEAIRRNEQRPFFTTAANADLIIADSQFGRVEIVRHLGVSPEKIDIIPLGVDMPPVNVPHDVANEKTPEPYILFVGQAESRKGMGTLLTAMTSLPDALREGYRLVVAGKGQPGSDGPVPDGVRAEFLGEVSDARLAELYGGASVFVFPSSYEGFGLPVLEAMSYGVPVVASDAASVPEAGGDAALYFPSGNAAALAAAIGLMLEDSALADSMRSAGLARASSLSWDRCADATLEAIAASAQSVPAL